MLIAFFCFWFMFWQAFLHGEAHMRILFLLLLLSVSVFAAPNTSVLTSGLFSSLKDGLMSILFSLAPLLILVSFVYGSIFLFRDLIRKGLHSGVDRLRDNLRNSFNFNVDSTFRGLRVERYGGSVSSSRSSRDDYVIESSEGHDDYFIDGPAIERSNYFRGWDE